MDKKDKKAPMPYDSSDDEELFNNLFDVASATECTGLMPTPPLNEAEAESYSKIYDIPLTKEKEREEKHLQDADMPDDLFK